jgi:hypothetical protein
VVDYLALDLGGAEYRIFEFFPFDQFKFLVIQFPACIFHPIHFMHGHGNSAFMENREDILLWKVS